MWKITLCAVVCYFFVLINSQSADQDVFEDEDEKKKDAPCGQFMNKTTGGFRISAPMLPDSVCNWTIAPVSNHTNQTMEIHVFLQVLYLHSNDVITIFRDEEEAKNDSNSLVNPIHAQNGSITVITKEPRLFIKLTGQNNGFQRKFSGFFASEACAFAIPPDLQIIHSPIPTEKVTVIDCQYTFNLDQHHRVMPAFTFEEFNFTKSEVTLKGTTYDGRYKHDPLTDFFPNEKTTEFHVHMVPPFNEYYRLSLTNVDKTCSGKRTIDPHSLSSTFETPLEVLNNGSITTECRYVFENPNSNILSVELWKYHFDNPLDIISINDGASVLSPPLLQVTASNVNSTKNQIIRSTGPYLWIAFKAKTYASSFSANVTMHEQGGYFKNNGTIKVRSTVGNDTVFLLEVAENEVVFLNFTSANFGFPATLTIYDGFDKTNLLANLHNNVPVLSKSNKMMVTATNFQSGTLVANFKGITPGCLHMSTFSDGNYILSGNCNNSCQWIIPPQDHPETVLLLNLQYLSLNKDDHLKIIRLDNKRTLLAEVSSNVTHVPQMVIPANVGALVEIDRASCKQGSENVAVVGHSSYVPVCGNELTLEPATEFQVTSPLYPDTYPVFAKCLHTFHTAKENIIHLSFQSLNLAPNHCVKITQLINNKTETYDGNKLSEDLFLSGDSVVEFDSVGCKTSEVTQTLMSAEGFVLNGTIADCGGVINGKSSGEFNTTSGKNLCIWKLSVPNTGDNVNVISYTVSKKDDSGNYELLVYDGNSVRESRILNETKSDIWSRTDSLIFVYKRLNVTKPSAVLSFKYSTISCNATMLCDNKICLHPDWRCNGINECGDYSDERNCGSVPFPPVIEEYGYSSTAFWITATLMLALGALLGVGVPYAYQKYQSGQYRRFDDLSAIH